MGVTRWSYLNKGLETQEQLQRSGLGKHWDNKQETKRNKKMN